MLETRDYTTYNHGPPSNTFDVSQGSTLFTSTINSQDINTDYAIF